MMPTEHPSTCRLYSLYSILASFLFLNPSYGQIGTITQDVTTNSVFGLQKSCARNCFVSTLYCSVDNLGAAIGCANPNACDSKWLATNDCYCRSDLQAPALSYLTSCIEDRCTVGDSRIDASSAGSIYAQYCFEKGYPTPDQPATIPAATTDGNGAQIQKTAGGFGAAPTASTTSNSSNTSSSKLSISTIIGIVVGSLAGLAFLAVALKTLVNCLSKMRNNKQVYTPQYQTPYNNQQQPVFTAQPQNGMPYFPKPSPMTEEVGPDDSVSMVGGPARPAPTLISATAGYPRRY